MNKKKTVKKFLLHLPIGIVIGMLISLYFFGIKPYFWQFGILGGIAISTYVILINANTYYSIENISPKDFLESSHTDSLPYDQDIWTNFNTLIEHQFSNLKVYRNKPNEIIVKNEHSIIKLTEEKDQFILSIEKQSFTFIPDRGRNYLLMKKIVKVLKR